MNNKIPTYLLLFLVLIGYGQQLERQVIGSAGENLSNGEISLDFTTGETIVGLLANESISLSQGFQSATVESSNNINDFQTSTNFVKLSRPDHILTEATLYPNPAKNNVYIKGVKNLERVEIININGQRVLNLFSNFQKINLSTLDSGVYFVNLETATASKTIKLIKN